MAHTHNTMTIEVMALDRNYYDYIRSNTAFAENMGVSINLLNRGVGVFGAVNIDSVNIRWE